MVTRREVVGAAVAGTAAAGLWKPCAAIVPTGARTYWKADRRSTGHVMQPWLEYDLGRRRSVSILWEGEFERELANIHRFWIDIRTTPESEWKRIADVTDWGFQNSNEDAFVGWPMNVFHEERRFAPTKARYVRLTVAQSVAAAIIHEFDVYER